MTLLEESDVVCNSMSKWITSNQKLKCPMIEFISGICTITEFWLCQDILTCISGKHMMR